MTSSLNLFGIWIPADYERCALVKCSFHPYFGLPGTKRKADDYKSERENKTSQHVDDNTLRLFSISKTQ